MSIGTQRRRRETGTVLIVVMWVVLVLVGLVLALGRSTRVEAMTVANQVAGQQAEAIARGALQVALAAVSERPAAAAEVPCEAVEVGDGYFWILRPTGDDRTYGFGIDDEAGKINLNAA